MNVDEVELDENEYKYTSLLTDLFFKFIQNEELEKYWRNIIKFSKKEGAGKTQSKYERYTYYLPRDLV
jgi:hypothetical protein